MNVRSEVSRLRANLKCSHSLEPSQSHPLLQTLLQCSLQILYS